MFLAAAIGAVIGAVAGGIIAAKSGKNVWAGIGIGAAANGLIGLGAGAAAGALLAGSATASTAAVAAGAVKAAATIGTAVVTAKDRIVQGVQRVGNAISSIGKTDIYRSVSQAEANSIKALDKFTISSAGMEAKQFGFSLSEVQKFGNWARQNIIAKASVPNSLISQLYTGGKSGIDNIIFRSGTLTVPANMLDTFNEAVAGSIQIMP